MKTSNSPRKEAIREHLSKFSVGSKDLFQNVCKMYCQGKPQIWNLIEILAEGQTNIFFFCNAQLLQWLRRRFYNKWRVIFCNQHNLKRVSRHILQLQQTISVASNRGVFPWVASDLQKVISAATSERFYDE